MQPQFAEQEMIPPYLRFERRGVEDREATILAGRLVLKDVDYVLINPAGSKDEIEDEVENWLDKSAKHTKAGRLPPNWLDAYRRLYEQWKVNQEIPEQGSSILNWPLLSPAQRHALLAINIRTLEQLAAVPDGSLEMLGMGGRELRERARNFLSTAERGQEVLAKEAQEVRIKALETLVEDLKQAKQILEAEVKALTAARQAG